MTMAAKPEPYFSLRVGEDNVIDLFMSFGLLNTLSRYFESPQQTPLVFTDSSVREAVFIELLSKRNQRGVIETPFNLHELRASVEDINGCLEWVEAHLQDFFQQAFFKAKEAMKHQVVNPQKKS